MTTLLAFDTSMPHCAAALWRDGDVVSVVVEDMARGQAERLMPMMEQLLATQSLHWRDLDRIGVGIGPGNFTGIRIAVSAARGLALGLGVPAIGVSLFDTTGALAGHAHTAVPAPREQSYVLDPGPDATPTLMQGMPDGYARASDYDGAQHITALAQIAATRAPGPAPAPLYVRPADAAPARDAPPVILDDA